MARCGLRGPSSITSRTPILALRRAQRRMCTNIGPVFRLRSTTASWLLRPESSAMSPSKGFTLAEMAVAVVILALLLFGAMVPFSAQVDIRSVADTRRTMDAIKEAIVGFALANGRLPCPADGSIAAGAPGAGTGQDSGPSGTA